MKEFNRDIVRINSTVQVKEHIMDQFYNALGVTKDNAERLSKERLDKMASIYFVDCSGATTNFTLPNQYHVTEVFEDYVSIETYEGFSNGYKELQNADIRKYKEKVNSIKLEFDDFYVMGSSI